MAFEFHLPDIGEGVVEGEIVAWRVKEGDVVALDQPIVEIMTDKATVEIPSPRAGRIAKINFRDGQVCPVGAVLVVIDDGGNGKKSVSAAVVSAPVAASAPAPATHAPAHVPAPRVAVPTAPAPAAPISHHGAQHAIEVIDATPRSGRVLATPATRRIARQLGVDLGRVAPTGKRGRVTTDDVRGAASRPAAGPAAAKHAPVAVPHAGPG